MNQPRRGEIWEVDWSPGRGSEQTGRRPALIVQNDAGNRSERFPNTIVVAISTQGRQIPFHVPLEPTSDNGLRETSFVKCEQIFTLSKERLRGAAWGKIREEELDQVAQAIKLSLNLA